MQVLAYARVSWFVERKQPFDAGVTGTRWQPQPDYVVTENGITLGSISSGTRAWRQRHLTPSGSR